MSTTACIRAATKLQQMNLYDTSTTACNRAATELQQRKLYDTAKAELKSELGHAAVGVLGFRLTELKHVIGLTKLNYVELGHAAVGVLGREAVGVLKGRPRLSHHVSHCVAPPARAIGSLILMTRFRLDRLIPCSSCQVWVV